MATIYNRIRNGMTNATEGDVTHLDTDFVSGAGVGDLTYDGITTQNTGSDRNILVTGGIFYVKNSAAYTRNQSVQKYRSYEVHDATVTVAVTPNTTLATRIDYLCLKDDTAATPDANASNTGTFVMVEGTVNNTAPAIPDNHLVLARLDLAQNFTGVTNAMITDMRVVATLANKDGWTLIDESEDPLAVGGTLAIVQYVSATSLKIYGDWTKFIGKYTKLKLKNTTDKYFMITSDGSFAASYTTYTIDGGGIYTIANAAISKVYYSHEVNPVGFPDELNVLRDVANFSYGMGDSAIINGNFNIWQRNTTSAISDVTVTYVADRFYDYADKNGGTLPTITRSRQALTAGTLNNSFYCSRLTTNGAGTSLGTASYHVYSQKIEYGTRMLAGAGRSITISFWAKSTVASKRIGVAVFQSYGTGGSPSATEVINGTNFTLTSTLTKYTATIALNTLSGKTFGTNNNDNLEVLFYYAWGSTLQSRVGASSAETYVGSGDTDIAQVKVNSGTTALPFLPTSYETELRTCQAFYEKSYAIGTFAGSAGGNGGQWIIAITTNALQGIKFQTQKRVSPTMTLYSDTGTLSRATNTAGSNVGSGLTCIADTGGIRQFTDSATPFTVSQGYIVQWVADAEL